MVELRTLNNGDEEQAFQLLEPLIERAPLVARRVAKHRPFRSSGDIQRAICLELHGLAQDERIQLFNAHPELSPTNPLSMTGASQSEQGRLNLTSESNQFREQLDTLNARYREKFGFPFITALVNHSTMDSVISEFRSRLAGDRESEIKHALEQVIAVSASRVVLHFQDSDMDTHVQHSLQVD